MGNHLGHFAERGFTLDGAPPLPFEPFLAPFAKPIGDVLDAKRQDGAKQDEQGLLHDTSSYSEVPTRHR